MHNGVISLEHVVQSQRKGKHPGFSAVHTARTNAGHCSAAPSGAQALAPASVVEQRLERSPPRLSAKSTSPRPAPAQLWPNELGLVNLLRLIPSSVVYLQPADNYNGLSQSRHYGVNKPVTVSPIGVAGPVSALFT